MKHMGWTHNELRDQDALLIDVLYAFLGGEQEAEHFKSMKTPGVG